MHREGFEPPTNSLEESCSDSVELPVRYTDVAQPFSPRDVAARCHVVHLASVRAAVGVVFVIAALVLLSPQVLQQLLEVDRLVAERFQIRLLDALRPSSWRIGRLVPAVGVGLAK